MPKADDKVHTASNTLLKSEYAAYRGCSPAAVTRALQSGRISVRPDGRIDVKKADAEWAANSKARGDSGVKVTNLHRKTAVSSQETAEPSRERGPASRQKAAPAGKSGPPGAKRTRQGTVAASGGKKTAQKAGNRADPGSLPAEVANNGQEAPQAPEPPPDPNSYASARARREVAAAAQAEIDLAKAAGRVIDREAARNGFFAAFRVIRNRVLSVPRQAVADIRAADTDREGEALLMGYLRAALGAEEKQVLDALAGKKGDE